MRITVASTSEVGLPLTIRYARGGHTVAGVDVNPGVVVLINERVEPSPGEVHLAEYLPLLASSGTLRTTTEHAEAIPSADAIVTVVLLVIDNEGHPSFRVIDSAARLMAAHLMPGVLISYGIILPVSATHG